MTHTSKYTRLYYYTFMNAIILWLSYQWKSYLNFIERPPPPFTCWTMVDFVKNNMAMFYHSMFISEIWLQATLIVFGLDKLNWCFYFYCSLFSILDFTSLSMLLFFSPICPYYDRFLTAVFFFTLFTPFCFSLCNNPALLYLLFRF